MGKRRINETCIAVSPTRLSRLLCNYCTACGDDAVERKHPKQCPRVQRFIAKLRE